METFVQNGLTGTNRGELHKIIFGNQWNLVKVT